MLSRVADSLYWMSRYLERAEHMARAIEVQLHLALDEAPTMASMGWVCLLNALRTDLPAEFCADDRAMTNALTFDRNNPSSIVSCIASARENARQIREQITSDFWEEINQLHLSVKGMDIDRMWKSEPHAFLRSVQRGVQLLAGVADSTMNHGEGWQFIRVGRFIERTTSLAWVLDAQFGVRGTQMDDAPTPEDFVAWSGLLRSCMAFESYCKVNTVDLRPLRILEFLLFDPEFPHSIRFCAAQLEAAIDAIGPSTGTPRDARVRRLAGRLHASLCFGSLEDALGADLSEYLRGIVSQCYFINEALYHRYISYAVDSALRGDFADSVTQ